MILQRQIKIFSLAIILLLAGCRDIVECHLRCVCLIKNNTDKLIHISATPKSDVMKDDIRISNSEFLLDIGEEFTDTIDLNFEHEGRCRIGVEANKDFYGINFMAKFPDTVVVLHLVPFDTTLGYFEFCSDCIHEYKDTLVIE